MLNNIKIILGDKLTKAFYVTLFLIVIGGFIEMIGIGFIPVFLLLVTNPDQLIQFLNKNEINLFNSIFIKSNIIIYYAAIGLILLFLLKNIYLFFLVLVENFFLKKVNQRVISQIYAWYLSRSLDKYILENPAYQIQILTKEIDDFRSYLRHLMVIFKESCLLFFIFILLVYINFRITVFTLFFLGTIGLIFFIYNRRILKKSGLKSQQYRKIIQKFLQESLSFIRLVRIHNAENIFIDKYNSLYKSKEESELIYRLISNLPKLIIESIAITAFAIFIIIHSFNEGNIADLVPMLAFLGFSFIRIMPSVNSLTTSFSSAKYFQVSLELLKKNIIQSNLNKKNIVIPNVNLEISGRGYQCKESNLILALSNVSYAHPSSSSTIINNLNLNINKGEFVAIIGKSGSGKSTLLDLIMGLKKPTSGSINLYPPLLKNNNLISGLGYVSQDTFIFDESVKRNIALAQSDQEINEDKVWKALALVKIDEFVRSLPNSINSKFGDRGATLSGGQKQRISLARAIYFNPQLLIIDEGTSALDTNLENELMESLQSLDTGITIIFVTHRTGIYKYSDRILELSEGKLINKTEYKGFL